MKSAIDAAPEPTTEAAPEEPGSGPDGDGGENKKEDNNKPPGEAAADSWAKADEVVKHHIPSSLILIELNSMLECYTCWMRPMRIVELIAF